MGDERRVAVVAYDGSELLDIACVTSTLGIANRLAERDLYRIEVLTPGGRPVACDSGLSLPGTASLQRASGPFDTLVVSGGLGYQDAAADAGIVSHVRRLARESSRIASVCTGAFVLAACGLLDGKRATTHWQYASSMARRYPGVRVDPAPIYIRERDGVFTAAGVTSALDLTLALIRDDHGETVSREVARTLVTYMHRPANQAQVSMFVATDPPDHRLVRDVVDYVADHVDGALDTVSLAGRFGVSERQLHRLFVEHVGETPGRYVRRIRTETAASLLATTALPISTVATHAGFGTAEALRQAFVAHYAIAPSRYRRLHAA